MKIKIPLKDKKSNWVTVGLEEETGKELQFLFDYPSRSQQELLDDLRYEAYGKTVTLDYSKVRKDKDINDDNVSVNKLTVDLVKQLKHRRLSIKYCVKGWKYSDGSTIEPFKLVNNEDDTEWDDSQWWTVVRSEIVTSAIFMILSGQISWDNIAKKK